MKTFLLMLSALSVLSSTAIANKPINEQPVVSGRVLQYHDWVFYGNDVPTVKVMLYNHSDERRNVVVQLNVTSDDYSKVIACDSQAKDIAAEDSVEADFMLNLAPGFYRCTVKKEILVHNDLEKDDTDEIVKKFNIGYEPEKIVSVPYGQPDLKQFWDKTNKMLAKVKPCYSMKLLKDSSNADRKVYLVSMKSLGGVTIQGYYLTPTKQGKYPADITYMGYGSKPWCPKASDNPNLVEFILSVRGQALNEPTNKYGDWAVYGLADKDTYYYRGAFMDLVRAIDFICSRSEVDKRNIFAEGGSQGGAFTFAACALDHRIRAAAPWIPFLSDYPDYFKIVHWPGDKVLAKAKELGINDEQLYKTLSYFDIMNLAGWIKCPILMGSGLQDPTCPPHINFAAFNQVKEEKVYRIHPTYGHNVPLTWWNFRMDFFKKYIVK